MPQRVVGDPARQQKSTVSFTGWAQRAALVRRFTYMLKPYSRAPEEVHGAL